MGAPGVGTGGEPSDVAEQGRARKRRRRRFAWQSGSEAEPGGGEGSDGGSSASECSSSSSSPPPPSPSRREAVEDHPMGSVQVIHTTMRPISEDYFDIRARSEATAAEEGPRPPPLREAAVARRRARLRGLRGEGDPGEWPAAALREAARQLRGRGFVVVDGFCGAAAAREMRRAAGRLTGWKPGGLGASSEEGLASSSALRGDLIAWLETAEDSGPMGPALRSWLRRLDALVVGLRPLLPRRDELANVSAREPPMASCYPRGAKYIRHYDNNCEAAGEGDCNGRRLSAVYYLNEGLSHADGGHLRLVGRCGRAHDVLPSSDVLVLFWADRRTPHEVLPNRGEARYALTCWFVDPSEAPGAPEARIWEPLDGCGPSAVEGSAAPAADRGTCLAL